MTLRRYLGYFSAHWLLLGVTTLLLCASAAVPGLAVATLQQGLENIHRGGSAREMAVLSGVFGGLFLFGSVLQVIRTALSKKIAWRVTSHLRRQLHVHLLQQAPQDQGGTGQRIASLTQEVDELQYGVSALVTVLRNPLTLLVLIGTAYWMAPGLALWALILVPFVALVSRWGGRRLRVLGLRWRQSRSRMTQLAHEQLTGVSVIQTAGAVGREHYRFVEAENRDRSDRTRMEVERVLPSALVQSVTAIGVALLLWEGGRQVHAGGLNPSQLVGFIVALGLMSRPLAGLSEVWSLLQRSLAALTVVERELARPVRMANIDGAVPFPDGVPGLRWESVSAGYDAEPVLHDVSLAVKAGESLALVGPTGGGKSTMVKIAARILDPTAGHVAFEQVEATQIHLDSLRKHVAYVPQEGFLFSRTILENLRLGQPAASRQEAAEALLLAGADAFVARLEQGMDTVLAEAGGDLSGGERQRICLARAILEAAPVLLLDEATNHLDAATEQRVLDGIVFGERRQTVVLVAHNLRAIQRVDCIAVVVSGRVVEQGTHLELLRLDGHYTRLWKAQERAEESE